MNLCKICRLPEELRDSVNEMLNDGLPQAAIQVWLEQHNVTLSLPSISRHKRSHLGILTRTFDGVGMPPDDAPPPLSLGEYKRRMSGYLQSLCLNQARFVEDRQRAHLEDNKDPGIVEGVKVLAQLVTLSNMYEGFSATASLDAAIEVLRSAGYEIQGTAVNAVESAPNYQEFKQWLATKE